MKLLYHASVIEYEHTSNLRLTFLVIKIDPALAPSLASWMVAELRVVPFTRWNNQVKFIHNLNINKVGQNKYDG